MRRKMLLNQRDLALLGNIGALALSAFAYFSLHYQRQHELPGLPPPSKLDPVAFAWERCNPRAAFPRTLKGAPSQLAMLQASVPQSRPSAALRKAA